MRRVALLFTGLLCWIDGSPVDPSSGGFNSHTRPLFPQRGTIDVSAGGEIQQPIQSWTFNRTSTWSWLSQACPGPNSPSSTIFAIDPLTAILVPYPKFVFTNYDKVIPMTITNNGRTVLLRLPDDHPTRGLPNVRGGALPDKEFSFVQLQFNWLGTNGKRAGVAEQHLVGKMTYPAEMHFIHYNTKYDSFGSAAIRQDGLAVLVVLVELQPRDNVAFRHIVEPMNRIRRPRTESKLPSPIPLMDLLPDDLDNFYSYRGPLTMPGCHESVTWVVFDTPIAISERELSEFRNLVYDDGSSIAGLMPTLLNQRMIRPRVTFGSGDGIRLRANAAGVDQHNSSWATALSLYQRRQMSTKPLIP